MEEETQNIVVENNDNSDIEILDDLPGSKKRRSEVWDHFKVKKRKSKEEKRQLECIHCETVYSYPSTKNGTSTLSRHLVKCKKKPRFGDVSSMFVDHEGKLIGKKIDKKTCRDWITKVSIAHNLPLNWIEYKNMRAFLKYLNPATSLITRNTLASDVLKMYEFEKEKLKTTLRNIPGKVCLTSDVWTACTTAGYICVTIHFVDEKWKLNSRVLAFCALPPPHSSPELAQKIYECLEEWEIDRKVFSLTLDNASSNVHMVRILKNRLLLQNSLLCNGDYFFVRCCAHILNLIVQDGLKVAGDALEKIRKSIKYVKASEARMNKFHECAQKAGIEITSSVSLDVATRWNSTYVMLVSATKYRRVFCLLEVVDKAFKHCPSSEEWERGEKMCEFLRPFYTITNLISGSSYPTSNLYFMEVWKIACLLEKNLKSEDEVVRDMTVGMKDKFQKYWEDYSDILAMGAIFDPRLKLTFLEYCYTKLDPVSSQQKVDNLKKKLYLLYDEYKKGVASSSGAPTSSSQAGTSQHSGGLEKGEKCKGLDLDASVLSDYKNYRSKGVRADNKSFLVKYLEEELLDESAEIDVLQFWKNNESRFGELGRMASDVLTIPITTVTSESTFSVGAHVLNKYRNRLLPGKVQALICTRNWLHGYPSDDDAELDDEATREMETGASCVLDIGDEAT